MDQPQTERAPDDLNARGYCLWCCNDNSHHRRGECANCLGRAKGPACEKHREWGKQQEAKTGYNPVASVEAAATPIETRLDVLLKKQILVERVKAEARDLVRAERVARKASRTTLVFDGDEDLRPNEYLVDGVIPAEGAGMLFGETDRGKTFLAVSLGVHVGAGLAWMGKAVKGGTVLFVESEGGRAFALRKHAAKGAAGLGDNRNLPGQELPFVTSYEPLGFGPDTDTAIAMSNAATIRREVEERGLPPIRLVFVDTLAQNISGDADNNEEMTAFLKVFRAFLKALSGDPVFGILVHHPGHAEKGRGRGAYALEADLDLVMHLEGESTDSLTLTCKRMRNDARFAPIHLRLESVVVTAGGEPLRDSRGREQTTLIVLPRRPEATGGVVSDPTEGAVLKALPDYPGAVGVQAFLVPKVTSILGRKTSKETITARCFTLEGKGLARSTPGRQVGSHYWGKAAPKPDPAAGDM